jgi:epoxyqueuosine reductase QueG
VNDNEDNLREILHKTVLNHGASLFGISDLKLLKEFAGKPPDIIKGFPFSISTGVLLSPSILETNINKPSDIYKYHYRQINSRLDAIGIILANILLKQGHKALPLPASQITDWDEISGDASHKITAYGAGLGFFGRNNLLVNPKYGSQVRYISIFTDAPLTPDTPLNMDCGDCYKCIEVCPAKCIGKSMSDFDLNLCKNKLKEFKKYEVGQYICGVCIRVCNGNNTSNY